MNKAGAQEKPLIANQREEEKSPEQRLHEANLKVTRPRLLVLSLLHEMKGHYSADEVLKMLQERRTPLPRASVYNALGALLNRGLVMSAHVGPDRVLYAGGLVWRN